MEYNSFYGGRRGASFVIVKKYRTIFPPAVDNEGFNKVIRIDMGLEVDAEITEEIRNNWLSENCMVTCFQQGGDYLVANYDEYVIIDTYNKNDIDNGKIYRRGYDYTNELGGAIYIGQIVGPAGMAPHTELKEYDAVAAMTTEDGLVIPNDGTTISDESLNQYRKTQATLDTATKDLLPGHYYDEDGNDTFNDTIEYIACSIKDFESHESTVHIGFKVPYHVIRYTAESVSPYYHRTDDAKYMAEEVGKGKAWDGWSEEGETTNFSNAELVQRTDDETHPFFSQWHISIPKGIKGETFKNFRITTAAEVDGLNIKFDENNNAPADYRETSDTYKKQILVYDYYNYDRDINGDPVSIYLGDYNMIEDFRVDEDGTIVIDYSHEHRDYYANYLKAVDTIQINPETGLLQIDYNYDQQYERDENGDFVLDTEGNKIPIPDTATHYETYLQYIKDITIDDNGTMVFYYSYKDSEELKTETFENKIKWIDKVEISSIQGAEDEGHLIVTYNTKRGDTGTTNSEGLDTFETDLAWVNNISMSDTGLITLHYSGKGEDVKVNSDNLIKWITEMSLDPDTALWTVKFNNGDPDFTQQLQWVKDLSIAADGTMTIYYANANKSTKVETNFIKWIDKAEYNNETGKFVITYNTSEVFETTLDYVKDIAVAEDGTITFDYTDSESKTLNQIIKTIKEVNLNTDTGHLIVTYNTTNTDGNNTTYETDLNWINGLSLAEDGKITLHYTVDEDELLDTQIKWITKTELAEDGTFTVTYNDGTTYVSDSKVKWINSITLDQATGEFKIVYNNGDEPLIINLKTPNKIEVDTGVTEGEGTQKLEVTYSTGEVEKVGNPINYIMRTAVSSDYHLLVLHSDPAKRQAIKEAGENYSFDGRDDWQDMGAIKDYDGLLVGMNISVADVPAAETKEGAVEYLNATYPDGLTTSGLEGKIVTVGTAEDDKLFYAYDYNSKSWYYLGGVQFDVVTNVAGKESDENTQALAEKMSTNGIWFVVE